MRSLTVPLAVALAVLLIYCAVGLEIDASCGPGRVAVVGLFGPECVCKGTW